jgi:hypothetical protein
VEILVQTKILRKDKNKKAYKNKDWLKKDHVLKKIKQTKNYSKQETK